MTIYKIKDTYKYLSEFYKVEAETKEEALDKYVNELAGSLERYDYDYDPDSQDEIIVID